MKLIDELMAMTPFSAQQVVTGREYHAADKRNHGDAHHSVKKHAKRKRLGAGLQSGQIQAMEPGVEEIDRCCRRDRERRNVKRIPHRQGVSPSAACAASSARPSCPRPSSDPSSGSPSSCRRPSFPCPCHPRVRRPCHPSCPSHFHNPSYDCSIPQIEFLFNLDMWYTGIDEKISFFTAHYRLFTLCQLWSGYDESYGRARTWSVSISSYRNN